MDTRFKALYEAAHAGDVYTLKTLLEEDNLLLDRVVTTIELNDNPLHVAAFRGHAAFAREILRWKPELAREFNGQGMSPLHLAAAQGHFMVVEELFEVGVDLCNLRENRNGYLPVHIAVIKGRHNLVTMLIEKCESSLNEVTYRSENLLHLAVKANCSETIEYFTARGDAQLTLNAKDSNGNTCLHLAFAGRQQQVIEHLLRQEGIDVNAVNKAGHTPLDELLGTNQGMGDLYLAERIITHGGKIARELGTAETNLNDSISVDVHRASQARVLLTPTNRVRTTRMENDGHSEHNLIVVATLVATVTFAAALNPPGGSIQMPIDKEDLNNSTWINNWEYNSTFPAGSPVYFWELQDFFKYDYFALFSSISVILFCLLGVDRKSSILKKLLRLGVWCSILFMVLAFSSAMDIFIDKYRRPDSDNDSDNIGWYSNMSYLWFFGFALTAAGLFTGFVASLIDEVPRRAKRLAPRWMSNYRSKPIWKKIKRIILVAFFLAIGAFVAWWVGFLIYEMAQED